MIRKAIRRACQSGILGFRYPPEFSIKTCLRWRIHRNEKATLDCLMTSLKSCDVFVDVGAHIGYHATYAARQVGRTGSVFAFEPHPANYKLLVHNCRHLPQIKTIQAAASDSSGQALLFEHSTSSSSHALTDLSGGGKSVSVRKVTLDEWAHENNVHRMDVVLIDVEGHESSVLRGMSHIIETNSNVIIIMEYCPSNWTSRHEKIDLLIKEIHEMQLHVASVLGQSKKYAIAGYTSETDLANRLAVILDEEIKIERCDYVNIVVRRRD